MHRDIKPENILLDRKGRVKIADFGLVKLMSRGEQPVGRAACTLTGSQQVMGTPHYMAPEQMERPQTVDHRADIYSLGVVFYEMLTGELPLGRFAPPSRKVSVDVRLDEVVLRSLEKEPERRYQQASEVKTDVERIAHAPLDSAWEERPAQKAPAKSQKSAHARIAIMTAGVVCALLVATVSWRGCKPRAGVPRVPDSSVLPEEPGIPTKGAPVSRPQDAPQKSEMSQPIPGPGWLLGPDGPGLSDSFIAALQLPPSQVGEVNKVLKAIHHESQALEALNREKQINDTGHYVVKIHAYPGPIANSRIGSGPSSTRFWIAGSKVWRARTSICMRHLVRDHSS